MWKCVKASTRGTSHKILDIPCQDYCEILKMSEFPGVLLVGISDGAGSAKYAEDGSRLIVERALDHFSVRYMQNFSRESASEFIQLIQEDLKDYATEKGIQVKDLAGTLLFACLMPSQAYFLQIGDGGWVIKCGDSFSCVTWPYSGEYANETKFVTSLDAANYIQFFHITDDIQFVSGFTDGMQSLVLDYKENSPHQPFFLPMSEITAQMDNQGDMESELVGYLDSESVNQKTDDDKTIVFCSRVKFT